jgi:hypothetical protein
MKAGYTLAAWRLFQPTLGLPVRRRQSLTWADAELATTPFAATTPYLPIVRSRGTH